MDTQHIFSEHVKIHELFKTYLDFCLQTTFGISNVGFVMVNFFAKNSSKITSILSENTTQDIEDISLDFDMSKIPDTKQEFVKTAMDILVAHLLYYDKRSKSNNEYVTITISPKKEPSFAQIHRGLRYRGRNSDSDGPPIFFY